MTKEEREKLEEQLKRSAIKMAHRTKSIHYVVKNIGTGKIMKTPVHCDTLIDWGKNRRIIFIAFPTSNVYETVVTEKNKNRFDAEEKLYAKYFKAHDRNHNLEWNDFISENPIANK